MYHLGQKDDLLVSALEQVDKPYQTVFEKSLSGDALKADNETFALAYMEQADLFGQAKVITDFGAHVIGAELGWPWELQKIAAAAMMSASASNLNISLRQEAIRMSLLGAVIEQEKDNPRLQGYGEHLGILEFLIPYIIVRKGAAETLYKSPGKFFSMLGKDIGTGLRKFGDHVRRLDQIVFDNAPWARWLSSLVGYTPMVRFVLNDMVREVGLGIETGESIDWKKIGQGGATYLKDMGARITIASNFAPPPFNIIGKIVGAIMQAGGNYADWAISQHEAEIAIQAWREVEMARIAYEDELFDTINDAYSAFPPKMLPSYLGSSGANNMTRTGTQQRTRNAIVIAGSTAAGLVGLKLIGLF